MPNPINKQTDIRRVWYIRQ